MAEVTLDRPDLDLSRPQHATGHFTVAAEGRSWRRPWFAHIEDAARPKLLVIGGQHGDEYQGPTILAEYLARHWAGISGNVVIVPQINPPAQEANRRRAPQDELDLNRSFPGRADGTVSQVIADFVSTRLLPWADIVLDIHSGGPPCAIMPSVMAHWVEDAAALADTLRAMRATELPCSIVIDESDKPGMLDTTVEQQGKPFLCAEVGGGGLSAAQIAMGVRMVEGLLTHLFPVPGAPSHLGPVPGAPAPLLLEAVREPNWLAAPVTGIFAPRVEAGDQVAAGERIGVLHPEENPVGGAIDIAAPFDGTVFLLWVGGRIEAGETIAIVAEPGRAAFQDPWRR